MQLGIARQLGRARCGAGHRSGLWRMPVRQTHGQPPCPLTQRFRARTSGVAEPPLACRPAQAPGARETPTPVPPRRCGPQSNRARPGLRRGVLVHSVVHGRPPARLQPVGPGQQAQQAVVAGAVALHGQLPGRVQQPGRQQGGIRRNALRHRPPAWGPAEPAGVPSHSAAGRHCCMRSGRWSASSTGATTWSAPRRADRRSSSWCRASPGYRPCRRCHGLWGRARPPAPGAAGWHCGAAAGPIRAGAA